MHAPGGTVTRIDITSPAFVSRCPARSPVAQSHAPPPPEQWPRSASECAHRCAAGSHIATTGDTGIEMTSADVVLQGTNVTGASAASLRLGGPRGDGTDALSVGGTISSDADVQVRLERGSHFYTDVRPVSIRAEQSGRNRNGVSGLGTAAGAANWPCADAAAFAAIREARHLLCCSAPLLRLPCQCRTLAGAERRRACSSTCRRRVRARAPIEGHSTAKGGMPGPCRHVRAIVSDAQWVRSTSLQGCGSNPHLGRPHAGGGGAGRGTA